MNTTKQNQIDYIIKCIENLPKKNWSECGDDDSINRVFAVSPYTVKDYFCPSYNDFKSGNFDFMNELTDKYDLFNFITKNRRFIESREHFSTNSAYDCTGKCIFSGTEIKRIDPYMFLIIQSASFDL